MAFAGGWLGATKGNDLSSSFFETSIGIGIPVGLIRREWSRSEEPSTESGLTAAGGDAPDILGITPVFRVDFIDAAAGIDIPAQLYETGVSFFYRKPINDRLSAMAIVRPSVRSDFTTSDNAVRIFGLGLLIWDCVPEQLSLSFGAVYLDRADLPLLPAVGLTWTPRTTTRLRIAVPTISVRVASCQRWLCERNVAFVIRRNWWQHMGYDACIWPKRRGISGRHSIFAGAGTHSRWRRWLVC